jgi:hypothetical protein
MKSSLEQAMNSESKLKLWLEGHFNPFTMTRYYCNPKITFKFVVCCRPFCDPNQWKRLLFFWEGRPIKGQCLLLTGICQ